MIPKPFHFKRHFAKLFGGWDIDRQHISLPPFFSVSLSGKERQSRCAGGKWGWGRWSQGKRVPRIL